MIIQLLSEFKARVAALECSDAATEDVMPPSASLLALVAWVREQHSLLQMLQHTMEHSGLQHMAVTEISRDDIPWVVARLLNTMYTHTCECATLGVDSTYQQALAMFAASLRPYLEAVEAWIQRGVVVDPHQEFMVWEDSSVATGTIHQWRFGFTLRGKRQTDDADNDEEPFEVAQNRRLTCLTCLTAADVVCCTECCFMSDGWRR